MSTTFAVMRAQQITDPTLIWDGSSKTTPTDIRDKDIYVWTANEFASLGKIDTWNKFKGVKGSDGSGYDTFTIHLMNDIDLNWHNYINWTIGWEDDNEFGGHFDGHGHTIYNLKIEGESANRALFGILNGGNVRNLKLVNVDIHAGDDNSHVAALCGRMVNHSTISHCAVINGSVRTWNQKDTEIGVIVGYADGNCNDIEYCYSNVDVTAYSQVGGIVGKMNNNYGSRRSSIRYCYYTGKITHTDDEYFAAIAGERYGNTLENNFYLNRNDGVKGTGNQSKYSGSSDDSNAAGRTDAELKTPLLFGEDNLEWIYPYDGYPELKVFLRYNKGDSFYEKNIGHMGSNVSNAVPGYVKVVSSENSPYTVELLKILPGATGSDFTLKSDFNTYFSNQPIRIKALAANVFQSMGSLNTVTLPNTLTSIATPQRHSVQNAFMLNGSVAGCSVQDGVLYDATKSTLITAPKSFTTMTIHQQYGDTIADYAFENMNKLRTLYVDTYVPAGTLVDNSANKAPVMQFEGTHTFSGCSSDLNVYIKDGTSNLLFLGKQGPNLYGYSNTDKWKEFYYEYEDKPNHMFCYFPVQRNAGGMSTLMLGYAVELPEDVTAWWARSLSDGNVHLQKLGTQIVPALTPVLLTYEGAGTLYLTRYEGGDAGAATDYEDNLFKGSVDPGGHKMTSSELMSNFFTLGRPAGDNSYDHLGFYQYHPKNNVLPANVAWIAHSDIPTGARFVIDFSDETTMMKDITLQPSLFTEKNVFTLQGIRINPSAMQKGKIYIVNGKKYMMK